MGTVWERVEGVRGDVGLVGDSTGEEGSWGGEAAERASKRRMRVESSLTWSISIKRDSLRIARGSATSTLARKSFDISSRPARHLGYNR
jgi:hypothetical protein